MLTRFFGGKTERAGRGYLAHSPPSATSCTRRALTARLSARTPQRHRRSLRCRQMAYIRELGSYTHLAYQRVGFECA